MLGGALFCMFDVGLNVFGEIVICGILVSQRAFVGIVVGWILKLTCVVINTHAGHLSSVCNGSLSSCS